MAAEVAPVPALAASGVRSGRGDTVAAVKDTMQNAPERYPWRSERCCRRSPKVCRATENVSGTRSRDAWMSCRSASLNAIEDSVVFASWRILPSASPFRNWSVRLRKLSYCERHSSNRLGIPARHHGLLQILETAVDVQDGGVAPQVGEVPRMVHVAQRGDQAGLELSVQDELGPGEMSKAVSAVRLGPDQEHSAVDAERYGNVADVPLGQGGLVKDEPLGGQLDAGIPEVPKQRREGDVRERAVPEERR